VQVHHSVSISDPSLRVFHIVITSNCILIFKTHLSFMIIFVEYTKWNGTSWFVSSTSFTVLMSCRFRKISSELPSYESQARTPCITMRSELNTRRMLPSLSTTSSMERPDRLPSLTSDSSMEDIKVPHPLKRRQSSPESSHVKSPLATDPFLSAYKLPAVKRQRSGRSSPILPKAELEVSSPKSHVINAPSCRTLVRPWEELSNATNTESCHLSNDPCKIDAKASSHYLGMHRNICSAHLPSSAIVRSVRVVIDHAHQLLQAVQAIAKSSIERSKHLCTQRSLEFDFSTPFVGYAILTAVDVLSAAGLVEAYEETMTIMQQSLAAVDRLSQIWASARGQSRLIRRRIEALTDAVNSKQSWDKSAWKCRSTLDPSLSQGDNVFYDSHDVKGAKLFEYLGTKVWEDEILLVDGI